MAGSGAGASPVEDPTEAPLKALAHPGRRQLLKLVGDGERTVGSLAEEAGLSQPATSQHLRVLREADLVTVRPEGNRRLYAVQGETLARVQEALADFWDGRLGRLSELASEGVPGEGVGQGPAASPGGAGA